MAGFSDQGSNPLDLRLIPHPAVTLLFDLCDLGDASIVVDNGRGGQRRGCVVAGLAPSDIHGRGGRGFECLQVRLSPLIAHEVFGAVPELSGAVADLDEFWGREAGAIRERLCAAGSWDERFAIAEFAIARRCDAGRAVDPEVAFTWRRTVAGRGRIPVERLAAEVGWSRKRLWSRFRSQIGITPKRAARLVRFDHAAHRLAAGHAASLVAAESGYTDQSHLHRDVMAFAGLTPAAVAAAPFLAVDDVAWPGWNSVRDRELSAGSRRSDRVRPAA
jgi:AraC-like DNA-binding protein